MNKVYAKFLIIFFVISVFFVPSSAYARTKSPAGAMEYIITPKDGETVSNPIVVRFGLKGMGVAPAGTLKENTGHHHLLIDVDELPPSDQPIPNDAKHVHFGGGQTETEITLEPGKHTLQLLLGDLTHMTFDPVVASQKITIEVK